MAARFREKYVNEIRPAIAKELGITNAMAGTTTEEWTVHKVKVNPKIDPKRFAGES